MMSEENCNCNSRPFDEEEFVRARNSRNVHKKYNNKFFELICYYILQSTIPLHEYTDLSDFSRTGSSTGSLRVLMFNTACDAV